MSSNLNKNASSYYLFVYYGYTASLSMYYVWTTGFH